MVVGIVATAVLASSVSLGTKRCSKDPCWMRSVPGTCGCDSIDRSRIGVWSTTLDSSVRRVGVGALSTEMVSPAAVVDLSVSIRKPENFSSTIETSAFEFELGRSSWSMSFPMSLKSTSSSSCETSCSDSEEDEIPDGAFPPLKTRNTRSAVGT